MSVLRNLRFLRERVVFPGTDFDACAAATSAAVADTKNRDSVSMPSQYLVGMGLES